MEADGVQPFGECRRQNFLSSQPGILSVCVLVLQCTVGWHAWHDFRRNPGSWRLLSFRYVGPSSLLHAPSLRGGHSLFLGLRGSSFGGVPLLKKRHVDVFCLRLLPESFDQTVVQLVDSRLLGQALFASMQPTRVVTLLMYLGLLVSFDVLFLPLCMFLGFHRQDLLLFHSKILQEPVSQIVDRIFWLDRSDRSQSRCQSWPHRLLQILRIRHIQ
mmetsp:Transcript_9802/g.22360  ORF Transcript_9802/g.22360 Transcript_9802/m.22360 type:complete len:215 (-) Transcript_9802:18-662(-)